MILFAFLDRSPVHKNIFHVPLPTYNE